jgi:phosphoribosylaminoimidazolecarboxamide formyltransferase/IMP cyclohydrolase
MTARSRPISHEQMDEGEPDLASVAGFPDQSFPCACPRQKVLRYGENPHQQAALYGRFFEVFEQLQGKELSFNNIIDISAATYLIGEFERPTVGILKHTNPCGVASADDLSAAWDLAFATDRQAPFGGIIVVNQTVDESLAQRIREIFCEVIIAPHFTAEALALFAKRKNLRLMIAKDGVGAESLLDVRSAVGGVLVQDRDQKRLRPVGGQSRDRAPTDRRGVALDVLWLERL